jgi:hypothetical protein
MPHAQPQGSKYFPVPLHLPSQFFDLAHGTSQSTVAAPLQPCGHFPVNHSGASGGLPSKTPLFGALRQPGCWLLGHCVQTGSLQSRSRTNNAGVLLPFTAHLSQVACIQGPFAIHTRGTFRASRPCACCAADTKLCNRASFDIHRHRDQLQQDRLGATAISEPHHSARSAKGPLALCSAAPRAAYWPKLLIRGAAGPPALHQPWSVNARWGTAGSSRGNPSVQHGSEPSDSL